MVNNRLIECVPNFSEGRDKRKIASIGEAMSAIRGIQLLHTDIGYDANRSVYTLVGDPEAMIEAIIAGFGTAAQLCDMTKHLGTHPRIGLLDVCPFIPLQNITLEEVSEYSRILAKRLAEEYNQTTYLYEAASKNPLRKNLSDIRKGEYEGLARKLKTEGWAPDFGSTSFLPRTGASIIGARPFLIAFNINLESKDHKIAKRIARKVRTSGYSKELTPGGLRQHIPGLLPALKAIGWYIKSYGAAQVSMNLVDFQKCGLHEAFEACKNIAIAEGTAVTGSELVGLVPINALLLAGRYYATRDHHLDRSEEALIELAVAELGLNDVKAFDAHKHIIEYRMKGL